MRIDNFVFLIFGIIVVLAVAMVIVVYEKLRKITMICSLG